MMVYDRKVDVVLPWLAFAVLAVVGIWMIAANGKWWKSAVPADVLPKPVLYYVTWIIFLVIFPFLYMMSLASAVSSAQRIALHLLFLTIAVLLLLWVVYLYHVKDVRLAIMFMGLASFVTLILVVFLWVTQLWWSTGSPTSGMALLFLFWLILTWYLTSAARNEGLAVMFRTMRERFLASRKVVESA